MERWKKKVEEAEIIPGMEVDDTEGDLGQNDLTKAKVKSIVKDKQGRVEEIKVEKGAIFRKTIDIPANRIEQINPAEGLIKVDIKEQELESLDGLKEQTIPVEQHQTEQQGVLDEVEQQAPTEQGMREKEAGVPVKRSGGGLFRIVGPGLLAGTSGNDSSAVTAYAIDGASIGYGHLWLMLISTPLYQAVQYSCAKIGRISGKGISQLLSEQYGLPASLIVCLLLVVSNVVLLAADLAAIGSGLELITGISWIWFVLPIAFALWYLTVFRNFETFKKIFLVMSFVFITYIITAFFSHADWGSVLRHTFVPQIDLSFSFVSSAVALLGATISPYSMFWQTKGEIEERRTGTIKQQMRAAWWDVASGTISGQMVAYFIIITTASTLFLHHQGISTAADAARSLEPIAGPLARYLFAIGLIGSGMVAVPVLLASTSYAITGSIGWSSGLSKQPWQNEGFYLILTGALVASLVIALIGINPIQLLFWANILAGVLAPVLVLAILLLGNNPRIMRDQRLGRITNFCLVLVVAILVIAVSLLFYGIATGQGS